MNRILLIGIILFSSLKVFAQTGWGLRGGINVSSLGTTSQYQPRLGYHLGAYYAQHIEEQYGWQLGLQYSLQGARVPNGANGRLSYHYLSVPLLLKIYFSGSMYIQTGPQIAYLVKASYLETGFKEDKTNSVKPWDFLGIIGVGRELDNGGAIGLRVGIGFTNPSGASVGNEFVPRNLFLQASYSFAIKSIEL